MIKPQPKQIVTDIDLRTQFAHAGCQYASFGNMDQENIFVVDPDTLEYIGKPQNDVEYAMLRSGINNKDCSFYPNAMVTKGVDHLLREHSGMTGNRDWYDVTMLVRVGDKPENLESLQAKRSTAPIKRRCAQEGGADVVQLFPTPAPSE